MNEQIKFVAVRPDGSICGPVGDTHNEVAFALKVGHQRAGGSGDWKDIAEMGYTIKKIKAIIIDE